MSQHRRKCIEDEARARGISVEDHLRDQEIGDKSPDDDERYAIEFERSHKQWMVIDTKDPDAQLGYYYEKSDAKNVADMLNHRIALLDEFEDEMWTA